MIQEFGSWKQAWALRSFRRRLVIGVIAVLIVLSALPVFFQFIQARTGPQLHDWLLPYLGPADVSVPLFAAIWCMVVLFIYRSVRDPDVFIVFVYGYAIVTILRMFTIWAIPLDPPDGLVPLVDPISNRWYGKTFVTRDLFFSGHTSTVWLIFLCFRRRIDRVIALICSIAVGVFVLVQHVHYTIDVVAAPVLTTLCYFVARKIVYSMPDHPRTRDDSAN